MIDAVGIWPHWQVTRKPNLLLIFALLLAHPVLAQEDQTDPTESTQPPATQTQDPALEIAVDTQLDPDPEGSSSLEEPAPESPPSPIADSIADSVADPIADPVAESLVEPSAAEAETDTAVPDGDLLAKVTTSDSDELTAADMLREFQVLYRSERLPEALDMAEQLVAYESTRQPPNSPTLIEPMLNLADAQVATGAQSDALRNYNRAVDLIERDGGVYDERLIEPLLAAAQILSRNGQYEEASGVFLRGQHVIHRDDGVFSVDQLDALDDMTRNYLAMDDFETANEVQIFSLNIQLRAYQEQPRRIVAARVKFANFKQNVGHYDQARRVYLDAIKFMEENMDTNDLLMVDVVQGLGAVGMHEQQTGIAHTSSIGAAGAAKRPVQNIYIGRKDATHALERTVEIMNNYPNEVTLVDRAYAYLDLGDWYLLIDEREKSFDAYQQAWTLLADDPNADELLVETFGHPKKIRYARPALPTNGAGRHENYDGTFVDLQFYVQADGSVSDITVIDSNTPLRMQNRMRHAMSRSLYRPKFEDGQPVAVAGVQYRETFEGVSYVVPD